MKKVSLHTFSFLMAFLVLFSTMSFTVEKHYCGQSLVDHAIFSQAQKCETEMHSCGVEGEMQMKMDESCCSNQTECFVGQDELNIYTFSIDLVQQNFLVPMSFVVLSLLPELPAEVIEYPPYQPPQLVYDLQILCQVFTI